MGLRVPRDATAAVRTADVVDLYVGVLLFTVMCCMLGITALGGMCVRETPPHLIRAQCCTVWGADNKAAQIRSLAATSSRR